MAKESRRTKKQQLRKEYEAFLLEQEEENQRLLKEALSWDDDWYDDRDDWYDDWDDWYDDWYDLYDD